MANRRLQNPAKAPAAILAAAVFGALSAFAQAPDLESMDLVLRPIPDGPVAAVAGKNISGEVFTEFYQSELNRARQKGAAAFEDGDRVRLALWCLGRLIEEELLLFESERRKLEVDSSAVEDAWNKRVAAISKNRGSLSEAGIVKRLGFETREEVLEDIRRFLLVNKARNLVIGEKEVSVTDEEIARAYEANKSGLVRPDRMRLSQIYISAPNSNSPGNSQRRAAARNRAQEALERIQAGQSFEGVARALSEAPGKESGGDLGMLPISQLPPFLVDAGAALKPGGISPVVESEYGFHIVKLVERVHGKEASREEARAAIENLLLARKRELAVRQYIEAMTDEDVEVLVFLELEKTLSSDPAFRELRLN